MAITLNGTTGITTPDVDSSADISVNGLTVGKGAGNVATNTAVGASALAANTTGLRNNAFGSQALPANTTGIYNAAFGDRALQSNVGGSYNSAFGLALTANTSGTFNTAIGHSALTSSTTPSYNTAIGAIAMETNTTGANNTALGYAALFSNTTASNNTAVGYQAGYSNATGTRNAYFGYLAGYSNNSTDNLYCGYSAGNSHTGNNSCFVGTLAGTSVTTGNSNTYVGTEAGYSATTGSSNTFVGRGAGYFMTTGGSNTIVGRYNGNQGGLDIRTANNYIVLSDGDGNPRQVINSSGNIQYKGATASTTAMFSGLTANSTTFEWGPDIGSSSIWRVQNSGGTGVYLTSGNTSWTANSDERLKDIIEPITDAANKVSTLRAVIGKYKTDSEDVRRSFLIAQDVQAVLPEAVDVQNDEIGTLGVQYTDVIPLLVAAIKELKSELDSVKAELATLKGN